MQAFHGSQEVKDKYLARIRAHREADELIKGIGWENGKGCAVGCTLDAYDPNRYPDEVGMPIWLARLEDVIFEGLPNHLAMEWPERFIAAAQPGANLESIRFDFLIFIVESTLDKFDHEKFAQVKNAIDMVLSALKTKNTVVATMAVFDVSDAWAAMVAADAAARAVVAADAAAWAANAAADAEAAAYIKFSDKLIELMQNCLPE